MSPFLFDHILRLLNHTDTSSRVEMYKFYAEIFEKCANELWKIDFNSPIARWADWAKNDITKVEKYKANKPQPENEQKIFLPLSNALKNIFNEDHLINQDLITRKKIHLLNLWLKGTCVDNNN